MRFSRPIGSGRGLRRVTQLTGTPSQNLKPQRRLGQGAGESGAGLPDHVERRDGPENDNPADGRGRKGGASRAEILAATDVRHIADPEDMAATLALAERLARVMRARLVRRQRARRSGRRLDLRRTIHRSISHGGTPLELVWRRRKPKPLRLVILLDASGSMSLYTAFFLRFIHGVVDAFREAEVFVFHTRLAHVSESLRDRDAARAIDRMSLWPRNRRRDADRREPRHIQPLAWGPGHKFAHGGDDRLRRLRHRRAGEAGPGDARLRRRCRRIVWLNPLIGWEDYAPEARGMQAALPYVDLFAPAHNLESLAALEPYLARI